MNEACALVLAAGAGRRFRDHAGSTANKLLAPCSGLDGQVRPVLEHTLLAFAEWRGQRLVVLDEQCADRACLTALASRRGFEVLPVTTAGMGDTLSAAVRARFTAPGWLVALGDMPWLRPGTLAQVCAAMAANAACVPVYQGQWGHPVGFGANFGQGLAALRGDKGGRRLLEGNRVNLLPVDDPGILRDVDLPADLVSPSPDL